MRTNACSGKAVRRRRAGFTLVEVLIAVLGVGIMTVTLYMAIGQGFAIIQVARENLRATQVLQEKMETMRIYNWDQITDGNFIPRTFTEPFYAVDDQDNGGFDYTGQVLITNAAPVGSVSYADNMRWVIVQVEWTSGGVVRRREMRTLVSEFGLHQYVY
jgi:prepilin-type N-terminal cleavage/methylation domain-containing protein